MEALTVDRGRPGVPVPSASARPGARLGRGRRRRPPRTRRPGHRHLRQRLGARGQRRAARRPRRSPSAWTIRGAPHAYRRRDVAAVTVATAPYSEADAAARVFDASKPLRQAGIGTLDALRTIARQMRDIVRRPMTKGDVSTELTGRLDQPFLRFCRPCNATHSYEQPFRLAALQAGLELEPGTSPPVLRRIAGHRPTPYKRLGTEADPRFDLIRGYLALLRSRTRQGHRHLPRRPDGRRQGADLPADAIEVTIDGLGGRVKRYALAEDADALIGAAERATTGVVRLVGSHDPYLQLRDRELLVADGPEAEGPLAHPWPSRRRAGRRRGGGHLAAPHVERLADRTGRLLDADQGEAAQRRPRPRPSASLRIGTLRSGRSRASDPRSADRLVERLRPGDEVVEVPPLALVVLEAGRLHRRHEDGAVLGGRAGGVGGVRLRRERLVRACPCRALPRRPSDTSVRSTA